MFSNAAALTLDRVFMVPHSNSIQVAARPKADRQSELFSICYRGFFLTLILAWAVLSRQFGFGFYKLFLNWPSAIRAWSFGWRWSLFFVIRFAFTVRSFRRAF